MEFENQAYVVVSTHFTMNISQLQSNIVKMKIFTKIWDKNISENTTQDQAQDDVESFLLDFWDSLSTKKGIISSA